MEETFIRDSTNLCTSIVGIVVSHLYHFSMCQAMPTVLYTRWDPDWESRNFKPRQDKTRSFENMIMSYFQRVRPQCKVESFYTTGIQENIDAYSVDGFCGHCSIVSQAKGCYYQYLPFEEARSDLTKKENKRGMRKRELPEVREQYMQEKDYNVIELYGCNWC